MLSRHGEATARRWHARDLRGHRSAFAGRRVEDVIGEVAYDVFRALAARALEGDSGQCELDVPCTTLPRQTVEVTCGPDYGGDGAVEAWSSRSPTAAPDGRPRLEFVVAACDVGTWYVDLTPEGEAPGASGALLTLAADAPVALWQTDAGHECTAVSRQGGEYTGSTPAANLGAGWLSHVHPDDRAQARVAFVPAVARREPFAIDDRFRRRDGACRWVADLGMPRFSDTGQAAGVDAGGGDARHRGQRRLGAPRPTLHVQVPDEVITVEGDVTRLVQVVVNLLDNAAKCTPVDGDVRLALARDAQRVTLTVRDTGVGMDSEMLPRVFDLFVQADGTHEQARSGLGIGLTLSRSLIEMHGGTVHAHSDGVGTGSAFTITLPAADCGAGLGVLAAAR